MNSKAEAARPLYDSAMWLAVPSLVWVFLIGLLVWWLRPELKALFSAFVARLRSGRRGSRFGGSRWVPRRAFLHHQATFPPKTRITEFTSMRTGYSARSGIPAVLKLGTSCWSIDSSAQLRRVRFVDISSTWFLVKAYTARGRTKR